VGDRESAREIGQEDRARLEWRDEQWLAFCVRFGELCAELGDSATDFCTGQVNIPDGVSVCRQGGS
jgi:hypothetical protein